MRESDEAPRLALAAGDDYELCFSAPVKQRESVQALATELGLPLTRVGRLRPGEGVGVRGLAADRIPHHPGYLHF